MTVNIPEHHNTVYSGSVNCCPERGTGARAMDCNLYDKCLYGAAIKNWESFNCELCRYESKGVMERIELPAVNAFEDDPIARDIEQEWVDYLIVVSSPSRSEEGME